jgi:hypothetical protein
MSIVIDPAVVIFRDVVGAPADEGAGAPSHVRAAARDEERDAPPPCGEGEGMRLASQFFGARLAFL